MFPAWTVISVSPKALAILGLARAAQATGDHETAAKDFQQMLLEAGVEPDVDSTPDKFRRSLEDDIAHWMPVISMMGFKID